MVPFLALGVFLIGDHILLTYFLPKFTGMSQNSVVIALIQFQYRIFVVVCYLAFIRAKWRSLGGDQ